MLTIARRTVGLHTRQVEAIGTEPFYVLDDHQMRTLVAVIDDTPIVRCRDRPMP